MIAGCDVPADPVPVHEVAWVSVDPAAGSEDVDRRVVFRLRSAGPVLPRSLQSAQIELRSGEATAWLTTRIDVLMPGVVITPRFDPLEREVNWTLRVSGLRDLDGAPFEPLEVRFRTGTAESPPPPVRTATWEEVQPIFSARCASCHGGPAPILGLDLSSVEAARATAIDVASQQVGPLPRPGAPGALGGLGGLRRIAASDPERSYLVYKLLGDPHVVGDRMPPAGDGGGALPREDLETIVAWIEGGARVP